ncbi:bestrophin family ion channel [uncultured Paludibaculum sp.]|uniref:bestrophin family protein n=1 Tax=uncultured Paludibaculum sp. TaxID=1765020 RepID=UPI002AAAD88B|nr:bestrophin family ion channel [uncultured Paludibaculum sp.]
MIVRDHLPLKRIWPQVSQRLLLLLLFDVSISVLYTVGGFTFLAIPSIPLAPMAGALSIFLAFRTNSAYGRWWEARTLWGGLVNSSRTFARQTLTLIDGNADDLACASDLRNRLVRLQISFVRALRCHLRRQNPFPELERLLPQEVTSRLRGHTNVPSAILLESGTVLRRAKEEGRLDSFRWVALESTLTELTNILGGCERIKNTPLPRQHDYFPRILVMAFCLMLPFALVEGLRMLTPIASTLISFILVALDTVGREIEAPFDNTVHDTPMTSLSRTIEINLFQQLGERCVPAEVHPVDGFVY